jgi:nitronate monooxygenase
MARDRRLLNRLRLELPIVQAPMAGSCGVDLAVAVSAAGGLGSIPCAYSTAETMRADVAAFRSRTAKPVNLNFFVHTPEAADAGRDAAWLASLKPYYDELGVEAKPVGGGGTVPFDEAMCAAVEAVKAEVVSFHFGLPKESLLSRVKATGAFVIASATTLEEARYLVAHGCDGIIAQGYEAGGHRGMFLTSDVTTQIGTLALVPQVCDAVGVPVIAAGGIADGRGLAAVLALGAAAGQIGTAFLVTPESLASERHRKAILDGADKVTAITNLFTGKPARSLVNRLMRELGAMSNLPPAYPTAGAALGPLRAKMEPEGKSDFTLQNAGQAAGLARVMGAGELTRKIADEAERTLADLR